MDGQQNRSLMMLGFRRGAVTYFVAATVLAAFALTALDSTSAQAQRVDVKLDAAFAKSAYTGRVFVFFAKTDTREPRLQAGSYGGSVPFYGVDVDQWRAGAAASIEAKTLGFPYETLAELPAGDYFVQAMLVPYTRFARADGHVIWVHNDQWEGQQFNRSPGNLVSAPMRLHWDPRAKATLGLTLTKTLPPVVVPPDTRYVKRIKIKSELLSKFWGQPMYIGATVLLPKGFDEEPTRRYPAVYTQGHFGLGAPFGFTEQAGSETPAQRAERLERSAREPGWMFARDWLGGDMPRMVAITWQHPTPYYDDSYAVNSVNNGPYQDALLTELVPVLEKQFRLIPEANARFLTGGSTGGWECVALQVQRPDFFGGAWCLYPDPVDFHRNQLVDNYADTNAFVPNDGTTPWPERFMSRTEEGQPLLSQRMMSRLEEVRGTKARSGEQFDAWDAAYGPIGADGYPKRLWNRLTGTIDKSVVAWWRDKGYDLTDNMVRNWAKNGPAMAGKMHVYVGDMDNYYLNLAVYRMEKAAAGLQNPKASFTFEYGRPMKPHGWQPMTNAELIRMMAKFRAEHTVRP
jgi:putative esterase